MTREEFKAFASGTYAMKHCKGTVNVEDMLVYVEGAMLAFDIISKLNPKHTEPHKIPLNKAIPTNQDYLEL